MQPTISLSLASLAATILASAAGTYIALSPPNPSPESKPSTGDLIRRLNLTGKYTTEVTMAPLGLLALHSAIVAILHPNVPTSVLGHGAENSLNAGLITWSAATSIPLALILCVGVPLRLVSYASLGTNFTFALAEPDRLTTTGIYRHVQHPSYTGVVVLLVSNAALLTRLDGVLSCWIPPRWYQTLRPLESTLIAVGLSVLMFGVWARVRQEERMLQAKFGARWETWHTTTARFVPWVF